MTATTGVPAEYKITVMHGSQNQEFSYKDMITDFSIYTRNPHAVLPFPYIATRRYYIEFKLNFSQIQALLPSMGNKSPITLLLYEGTSNERNEAKLNQRLTSEVTPISVNVSRENKEIHAIYSVRYDTKFSHFISNKSNAFLHGALKIHDTVIKYIFVDLCVFSSKNHVTLDHTKLQIGHAIKSFLASSGCFWYNRTLCEDKITKKVKQVTHYHEAKNAAAVCLKAIERLRNSDEPDAKKHADELVSTLVSKLSPNLHEGEAPSWTATSTDLQRHEAFLAELFHVPESFECRDILDFE